MKIKLKVTCKYWKVSRTVATSVRPNFVNKMVRLGNQLQFVGVENVSTTVFAMNIFSKALKRS